LKRTRRIWSSDQRIRKLRKGRISLTFSVSSQPELIGWVLSFGEEAKVVKPDWLVKKIKEQVDRMKEHY
jgi:predicted DNA-binding transcriptional regulator YafY